MKYEKLCKQIIELVGGKENIEAVVHCMTRLRFTLKDQELANANKDALKAIPEVIDVVSNKVSFQIIIGTEVNQIHPELLTLLGMKESEEPKVKKNIFKAILDVMSESISPIIPAMMAVGLMAGVLAIFVAAGVLKDTSPTYIIFNSIKDGLFYFLPIFMAVSASKRLGAPMYLGILLAGTLLTTSLNGVEGLSLFGLPLQTITYSNTFIPILLGLWFMGRVNKVLVKIIPKSLEYFFSPLLLIAITLPVTLFLFGPIGTWISDGLTIGVEFLTGTFGTWIVLALYAACQPLLIMMGAGNFIVPLVLAAFASQGYEEIFIPAFIISDLAVSGAMLGYFIRSKNKEQKQFFGSVAFSAFMGITEPAVFGAFVKYRRPFIAVMIGGGLGGLFAGLMHVKAYAMTNLFGLVSFIGNKDHNNFYFMIIALVIGFVVSLAAGYLLWLPKNEIEAETVIDQVESKSTLNTVPIATPVSGEVKSLAEVKDDAFSSGALGTGVGIVPTDNLIKSPIKGKVASLFPTNHAIGVVSEEGVEVLIHIGIDTVDLKGQYFEALVEQGAEVDLGSPLIEVDFEQVKAAGYDPTVIMIITNTQDYLEVLPNLDEDNSLNNDLITVIM
ncbi:beta-glucoside-specific PTS transporter subunit IIABC [Candidatus Enterococcus murrayae]|uniref:PTS glucose transporter subunit IIA n=1 Tax=Candidatus Enterococcus murrayae TaxID=2815321 RepID=A0ABS3HL46_9ENTE|nr:beta-glucoside-specific PTS transporter subunit IIABC [Enterococcus sp. MJM16]MBO0453752.1 PTS glucose transporter subunit IIA [Enterococcus sp. MJM16]